MAVFLQKRMCCPFCQKQWIYEGDSILSICCPKCKKNISLEAYPDTCTIIQISELGTLKPIEKKVDDNGKKSGTTESIV